MKDEIMRVDCRYLQFDMRHSPGAGGTDDIIHNPRCTCQGAPNYDPDLDGFAQKCSECNHNRWSSEGCR